MSRFDFTTDCSDELQNAEVVFADQHFLQTHLTSLSQARWIQSTTAGVRPHSGTCRHHGVGVGVGIVAHAGTVGWGWGWA